MVQLRGLLLIICSPNEAVGFLGELLLMVPPSVRGRVTPRPEVMGCPDILELLTLIFGSDDRRVSFEAQRKLYLSKLFFDVDHNWEVQRGSEHREHFEAVLEREFFARAVEQRRVDICYALHADGESIEYSVGRLDPGQECWTFDLREIELMRDGEPVRFHVYFYACRFKREVIYPMHPRTRNNLPRLGLAVTAFGWRRLEAQGDLFEGNVTVANGDAGIFANFGGEKWEGMVRYEKR